MVILNTTHEIEEGLQQLSDDKFYKPLPWPNVVETARKVQNVIFDLYRSGHIDNMTFKWLKDVQKETPFPKFYTLTKIHKKHELQSADL